MVAYLANTRQCRISEKMTETLAHGYSSERFRLLSEIFVPLCFGQSSFSIKRVEVLRFVAVGRATCNFCKFGKDCVS